MLVGLDDIVVTLHMEASPQQGMDAIGPEEEHPAGRSNRRTPAEDSGSPGTPDEAVSEGRRPSPGRLAEARQVVIAGLGLVMGLDRDY
jgi:hypothetical protein